MFIIVRDNGDAAFAEPGRRTQPGLRFLKLRFLDFAVFFVGRVPRPDQLNAEKGGPRDPSYKLAQLQKLRFRQFAHQLCNSLVVLGNHDFIARNQVVD